MRRVNGAKKVKRTEADRAEAFRKWVADKAADDCGYRCVHLENGGMVWLPKRGN